MQMHWKLSQSREVRRVDTRDEGPRFAEIELLGAWKGKTRKKIRYWRCVASDT